MSNPMQMGDDGDNTFEWNLIVYREERYRYGEEYVAALDKGRMVRNRI